jgi:hypothetical protein
MKKIFLVFICLCGLSAGVYAQTIVQVTEQLVLDIEKLSELKSVLSDMYKSYEIIEKGYNDIKNIAQGNFNLHEAFLDGLLLVSPAVKNYERIADIVNTEAILVSEYKSAYSKFQSSGHFTLQELDYISSVYTSMINESLKGIDELVTVLTASKLRMSDNERLGTIDRIYTETSTELGFLRSFNMNTSIQALHRAQDAGDVEAMKSFYDLP